ncbi:putative altered inheritance of mitochondria protein 13, mitochondrial [Eremomyces bilateralis CBS 781.70]|uniref:Altered inheritance of mitochondria protein 13, mitochondrial n=1 Tax=Eremomyces bilateralis CBS 781.70 TaxID=1392243 RepID=A0A6G1FS40_9PEZI|nr:putative altered inheritance of mitochondria protein 13, mitochondrial [Eremomyces bilateralis CBS 781.70]KAF1808593.1 putative altered inheritance of mitochondria protein 13, mitochondrial [Eremomyces bilateralis CBS 781.70]
MGAGNSKPASDASQHVFSADSPVRFSHDLVESLQKSPQSDSIRNQALELHIQTRLASELEKAQADSAAHLAQLSTQLSSASASDSSDAPDVGREVVAKEIASLRTKLAGRKKVEEVNPSVEAAQAAVVRCLREHDRRPLNCWEEVEAFRREVGTMERAFVERTVGS